MNAVVCSVARRWADSCAFRAASSALVARRSSPVTDVVARLGLVAAGDALEVGEVAQAGAELTGRQRRVGLHGVGGGALGVVLGAGERVLGLLEPGGGLGQLGLCGVRSVLIRSSSSPRRVTRASSW
ncbi:hypothetical protein [Micromonospora aurantiaca]|uniref:hypothetical protein n=1 Tax=Micromonospora aurantiaca (nom. illeg.) TaxID=47850 RepID=UPI001F07B3BB|nr:hypothetical protein [Micromonospora aurantiaca]